MATNKSIRRRKRLALAGAAAAAVVAVLLWALSILNSRYDGEKPCWVYLPEGTDTAGLNDAIADATGSRSYAAKVVTVFSHIAGSDDAAHGAYRIDPGETARTLGVRIAHHRQTPVQLVINNVRTFEQLASLIGKRCEIDSLTFCCAADTLLPAAGFRQREQFTAAFLPDTYEIYWTESANSVVRRLLDHRKRFWNDTRMAQANALGITPLQASILASIAEEETNDRDERAVVARLYLNRLHRGMRLQADPTVKFAVGDFALRRITATHLACASPYNTYRFAGLPPGPIRIAEARTIDALLQSAPHNYIYMCAKEDFSGRHNFASDYAGHSRNAAAYHKALNARQIH